MRNNADGTGGKPITAQPQSISGASALYHLVAFYDIHGKKRVVLFFILSRTPHKTRDRRKRILKKIKFPLLQSECRK
jgi:hypothetical protein